MLHLVSPSLFLRSVTQLQGCFCSALSSAFFLTTSFLFLDCLFLFLIYLPIFGFFSCHDCCLLFLQLPISLRIYLGAHLCFISLSYLFRAAALTMPTASQLLSPHVSELLVTRYFQTLTLQVLVFPHVIKGQSLLFKWLPRSKKSSDESEAL